MRIAIIFYILTVISCSSKQGKEVSRDINPEEIAGQNFREEFISLYSHPIKIDTTFEWDDKIYRTIFRHFSTMDSALIIPAKYNFDINAAFATHNFESELILLTGSDIVFKSSITKLMFDKLLDSSLRDYATLLYPNLDIKSDSIKIQYSISIPVTDIGISATICIDKNGRFTIVQ